MSGSNQSGWVLSLRRKLERKVERSSLIVALLGAGRKGLEERRAIARDLSLRRIIAIVPEDDLPRGISPSLAETAILFRSDVSLIFINVESWGSAAEFGQFSADPDVARKLRVLVRPRYHPLHGTADGYLQDLYLTHMVSFGHVYPIDGRRLVSVPTAHRLVTLLAERHRQIRALHPDIIK